MRVAGACRNRTYQGSIEPQTVLKTAQATRPAPPPHSAAQKVRRSCTARQARSASEHGVRSDARVEPWRGVAGVRFRRPAQTLYQEPRRPVHI